MSIFTELEILPHSHFTCNSSNAVVLKTFDLREQIAFTYFAPQIGKAGMARGLLPHQLDVVLQTLLSTSKNNTIDVTFVGGDTSTASKEIAAQLVWHLNCLDANRNIINIISFDVGDKPHPESFLFSCSNGHRYLMKE